MKRREAREIALCLLFDFSFNNDETTEEVMELYLRYFPGKDDPVSPEEIKDDAYISTAYYGVTSKLPEIDSYIESASANWKPDRISRVSRNILRLAIFEMLYMDDIPYKVSANEAVELAKKFDHENGYTFINGILGNVVGKLEEISESNVSGGLSEKNEAEKTDE